MRFKYFDVAKGILIVFVIIHHLPAVASQINLKNLVFEGADSMDFLYRGFFMPAFFFITGCCSNFEKRFNFFFVSNIKGLLVPAVTMGILCQVFQMLLYEPHVFNLSIISWLYCGGPFWFLSALFLSKCIFWIIHERMRKYKFAEGLIIFVASFVVSILCSINIKFNPWYIQQAILLIPFLYVGNLFKYKQLKLKHSLIMGGGNLLISCFLRWKNYVYPSVTMVLSLDVTNYLNYLFIAITGSLFVIGISQKISSCVFLEYLGKSSIVIYTLHIEVILFLLQFIKKYIDMSMSIILSLILFVGIVTLTILISSILALILNTKKLNFLLGKF